MGNNPTKEARGPDSPSSPSHRHPDPAAGTSQLVSTTDRHQPHLYASRTGRGSRPDLSFLGIGSSSNHEVPEQRRETKQEREARKLEKERQNRIKEREKSLKEEHVDGGYLVTMGVYTGTEDFSKPVVRQLMIERRMAPFWRGLNDFSESWTEHQLVAAGRGLPIPSADEIPQDDLSNSLSPGSQHPSNQNLHNLMVPIASRSHSTASDASATLSPSHPAFSNASPSAASPPAQSSSPFRPRSKTLASLTNASKNPSSSDLVPREIQLPRDQYVNGQAIEVFLYKDATECPICFLSYPPYLNKTRCCDQPICSECFVQIKRPDPHPPDHHDPSNPAPAVPAADPEALVSEPACCPYCQQPEFGVTYDAPPFRRGLAYANALHGLGSFASAMSSSSSINSTASPATTPLSPNSHKRRTTSISANASTVITTDRVRPDWATKLANARSHLARRSAAATALHTAAYLMNGSQDTRSFGFRANRLGRNRGESNAGASGAGTPSSAEPGGRSISEQINSMRRDAGESGGSRRRGRIEDLEEMMMLEAIRLSLAAEEERKKKAEKEAAKEAAKEAKRKAKEDKKREKRERKGVYGSGASSASGSALSLNLPGLGRRRGNSGASMLQREITTEDSEPSTSKGKGIDRSSTTAHSASSPIPGARHLDTSTLAAVNENHQPSASPTAPDRPSHLRQMSNASSPASSFIESVPGSLRNEFHTRGSNSSLDSPNTSGIHIDGHTGETADGDANGSAGSESMFNFRSLAAMIGHEDEESEKDAAKHIEHLESGESSTHSNPGPSSLGGLEESIATLRVEDYPNSRQAGLLASHVDNPEVMITPETPAADTDGDEDGKQLGAHWNDRATGAITQ